MEMTWVFDGARQDDTLLGEDGDDILYGGGRHDYLNGGNGNDILYGGWGRDLLVGGAGNDYLYGDDDETGTDDTLWGDEGDDVLYGVAGNDIMNGGAGNDRLDGGTGNDTIDGGDDSDTLVLSGIRTDYLVRYNPDGSITLTDARAGSPDGSDTVRNVEWFQFSDGLLEYAQLNSVPVITSDGGGATASVEFAENGVSAVSTVQAVDADVGQLLTYRILGGADATWFVIDGTTGALSFSVTPDFENPLDAGADNVYVVTVAADDGAGGVAQQQLSITITDVADGAAPVIAGGRTADVNVDEGSLSVATIVASDPDGPAPHFSIVGGTDAAFFTIDQQTGELAFASAPDFEAPADQGNDNVYEVTVAASDGVNSAWQTLSVTIINVNDNSPVITSNGGGANASLSLVENTAAVTTVVAFDADGPTPGYSITGGADADLFTIDAVTGALIFLAAPDREAPADADSDNIYEITVSAGDGVNSDSQTLSINVLDENDNPPVITSNGGGGTATVTAAENQTSVTTVVAADADGNAITYGITGGADAAMFSIDGTTGVLQFVNSRDYEHPLDANLDNIYEVVVTAGDGTFSDQQTIQVSISDVNEIGRTIVGNGASETFSPALTGKYQTTDLIDTIYGNGGHDIIDGGGNADYMAGGAGNDTYYVDTWSDNGWDADNDQVIEAAGGGTDLVNSTVSYRLTANVESLTLIGAAAISGWGNELSNTITGNGADNVLDGGAGNDRIYGGAGNDTILGMDGTDIIAGDAGDDWVQGGAGSDQIDGGSGADIMEGGAGNDVYFVDDAGDQVIELSGAGTDRVNSSVSYVLTSEVEQLVLTGSDALDGTGNALGNIMTGNVANNLLVGLDGDDVLDGLGGNDRLEGGAGNDTLRGSDGDDVLIGGIGQDLLVGGAGADTFYYAAGDTSVKTGKYDTITDLVSGVDQIDIESVSGGPASYAETSVTSATFASGYNAAKVLASAGAQVVFVAGPTNGWLFWDDNGDTLLDQVIAINGANSLGFFAGTDIV